MSIGTSTRDAAEDAGINRKRIIEARKVSRLGSPELIQSVESGKVETNRRRNLTPAWVIELELGNKEDLVTTN